MVGFIARNVKTLNLGDMMFTSKEIRNFEIVSTVVRLLLYSAYLLMAGTILYLVFW